jgi:D-alanyl-D-alanine carboxypeptidase/D-alanyl-D-alanine-endopeptidase (penicillin-binding protein 4)
MDRLSSFPTMFIALLLGLFAGAPSARTLDSLLEAVSRPRGGTASGCAIRLRDDSLLWEHDAWRRMLPASTQKTLAAASLRHLLGPGSVLTTRLLRSGALTDSVIQGDLVLEGGGDPSFAREPDSLALEQAARELRAWGLRGATGSLVIRDALLKPGDSPWPGSWDWDNSLTDCDGGASAGISVDGNCPNDSSQAHPHRRVALRLRRALARSGIEVQGPDRFELGRPTPPTDTALRTWASPPLDTLLARALWKSSNHDMETFGLVVGRSDPVSARRAGIHAVRRDLAGLGLDTTSVELADQSGLSRKNAVSTGAMARALARIARDPRRNVFPLLPSPGQGTLKKRFQRTLPAGTSLRAKTGSLDGVSTLIGLLVPPDGDSLVFAVFFNGHAGPSTPIRFAQDQIVGVLAGGPVVPPTAQDTTPPPPRAPKPPRLRPALLDP